MNKDSGAPAPRRAQHPHTIVLVMRAMTRSLRWKRCRCAITVAVLVLMANGTRSAVADPVANGTRLPLPGLDLTAILCGRGAPTDGAVTAFVDALGDPRAARVALVHVGTMPATAEHAAMESRLEAARVGAVVRVNLSDGAARLDDAIDGLWITADSHDGPPEQLETLARLVAAMRSRPKSGAVIGAALPAAAWLGGDPSPAGPVSALRIVPAAIIRESDLRAQQGAPLPPPGWFTIGLDPRATIVAHGRRARVVGAPWVSISLEATTTRAAHLRRYHGGATLDLIALSRAAVARAESETPGRVRDPAARGVIGDGTLFIGGGGRVSRAVVRRFITAAGGRDAPIVVMPAALGAEGSGRGDVRALRSAGARRVLLLDARTPADAQTPDALAMLREAGGLWFSGGRQWRLVDAFLDTKAHALMRDVVRRGGAVFGSSAGASIQAQYMVRGHPLGNQVMMAEGYERGLGLLRGVAIDQHFSQRNRYGDLRSVKIAFPELLCIGIDEDTQLIVRGGIAEVTGGHRVAFFDRALPAPRGEPEAQWLEAGDRFDLISGMKVE